VEGIREAADGLGRAYLVLADALQRVERGVAWGSSGVGQDVSIAGHEGESGDHWFPYEAGDYERVAQSVVPLIRGQAMRWWSRAS
jgi:hypothetical protein